MTINVTEHLELARRLDKTPYYNLVAHIDSDPDTGEDWTYFVMDYVSKEWLRLGSGKTLLLDHELVSMMRFDVLKRLFAYEKIFVLHDLTAGEMNKINKDIAKWPVPVEFKYINI